MISEFASPAMTMYELAAGKLQHPALNSQRLRVARTSCSNWAEVQSLASKLVTTYNPHRSNYMRSNKLEASSFLYLDPGGPTFLEIYPTKTEDRSPSKQGQPGPGKP